MCAERAGLATCGRRTTCWTRGSRWRCTRSRPSAGRTIPRTSSATTRAAVLTTARDIIFLWVARMIFSGLELLGEEPFDDVLIHSTLLEPRGAADVADARHRHRPARTRSSRTAPTRRATGCSRSPSTQDARFSFGAIEEGRRLAIKLWNVARLILAERGRRRRRRRAPRALEERWILARLDAARAEVEERLGALRLRARPRRSSTT